ncbi:ComF family protein [Micrococcales bacterium 31B]|nr:ComF family protein [Micrococcales bacterium 31B]
MIPSMLTRLDPLARTVSAALGELVFPTDCPCGRPDRTLCADCRRALCGSGFRCDTQATRLRRLDPCLPTFAGLRYEGAVRRCLLDFKDAGRLHLAPYLAPALGAALDCLAAWLPGVLAEVDGGPVYLVPVPASAAARARRGEDHVALLLRVWRRRERRRRDGVADFRAWAGPVPRERDALRVTRAAGRQKGMSLAERGEASTGKYSIRRLEGVRGRLPGAAPLAGSSCIIIDDVVTSGATLEAASVALRMAGVRVLGAACVAATPRS